jgi:hypothetical protein
VVSVKSIGALTQPVAHRQMRTRGCKKALNGAVIVGWATMGGKKKNAVFPLLCAPSEI